MSSEARVRKENAVGSVSANREWRCSFRDGNIHSEHAREVWKECQEQSFWYRALPFSLGSVAITGALIYNDIWKKSKRFGPFPKLAVAGILGYAVGKASYVSTCRRKFQELGIEPAFGPWSGPGHRSCQHVCEECKKNTEATPAH
ncbi:OCIA domain-containing protein 2 isoform X2 [Dunckerocampus dactyliophorus]|uniref:OCIA domain-containing protein 2 isoform X2 n=1 Tax=Dunckerocampus dactyliophorus TaxID=161453 RepID=UPI002405AE7A|nr:OCIA domain-containing protein 2 isoform X2 [Dunckerocampus dactyliophorus]